VQNPTKCFTQFNLSATVVNFGTATKYSISSPIYQSFWLRDRTFLCIYTNMFKNAVITSKQYRV